LTISLPGKRSRNGAFCSIALNPSLNHSLKYVDWKMPMSTCPSLKTSLSKSSSEYFSKCSSVQCVSGGPSD
jgi:hypothetical protein